MLTGVRFPEDRAKHNQGTPEPNALGVKYLPFLILVRQEIYSPEYY